MLGWTSHMSAVCLPVYLLLRCSAAENDWVFFMLFSDSHQECNICKKSCLEMASVGSRHCWRRFWSPTAAVPSRTISRNRSGQSPRSKNQNRTISRSTLKNYEEINVFVKGIVTHSHRDHVPAMFLRHSRCPQACCQVRFQASLRRCCPKPHPCPWARNNWDCRTWAKHAVNCVPWTDAQMKKKKSTSSRNRNPKKIPWMDGYMDKKRTIWRNRSKISTM